MLIHETIPYYQMKPKINTCFCCDRKFGKLYNDEALGPVDIGLTATSANQDAEHENPHKKSVTQRSRDRRTPISRGLTVFLF